MLKAFGETYGHVPVRIMEEDLPQDALKAGKRSSHHGNGYMEEKLNSATASKGSLTGEISSRSWSGKVE